MQLRSDYHSSVSLNNRVYDFSFSPDAPFEDIEAALYDLMSGFAILKAKQLEQQKAQQEAQKPIEPEIAPSQEVAA